MFACSNIFEKDIFDQPESLMASLDHAMSEGYPSVMKRLAGQNFKRVILTGMGSSYAVCLNAGKKLACAGISAWTVATSELLHYQLDMIQPDTLLVIVSQSGLSGETIALCHTLSAQIPILAVTNDASSELAKRGNEVLLLDVLPETSVSTRTYLTSMMLMDFLAGIFTGESAADLERGFRSAGECLRGTLYEFGEQKDRLEAFFNLPPYIMLLGRGSSYTTAQAGALFTREVAKFPAMECESAQFRHGPFEIIDDSFSAMMLIPNDACAEMQARMAGDIARLGGKVAVIAQKGVEIPENERILTIRQDYPSAELAPYVNIEPIQAAADFILQKKGVVAGTFRAASKVTRIE